MHNQKILVVDDDSAISKGLLEVLNMEGYNAVDSAPNGLDGLEKYKTMRPDLVIMDMEMPVMNGYESSQKIKEINPNANILVLTGTPENIYAKKTIDEGYASVLLTKPVSWGQLRQTIERHLPFTENRNTN
jgi:two-component system chemotaxis response regulator CheY